MELLIDTKPSGFKLVRFIEEGQEIGQIVIDLVSTPTKLWSFMIYPKFQGRSLGTVAFKMVMELLKDCECWLYVYKDNHKAISIYKKCGFEIIEDRPDRCTYHMLYKPK